MEVSISIKINSDVHFMRWIFLEIRSFGGENVGKFIFFNEFPAMDPMDPGKTFTKKRWFFDGPNRNSMVNTELHSMVIFYMLNH